MDVSLVDGIILELFVSDLQNWSEEAAASAQAWVDTCSMDHGPPSSRMLGGTVSPLSLLDISCLSSDVEQTKTNIFY